MADRQRVSWPADAAEPAAPTSSIAEASAEVVDTDDDAEPAAPTSSIAEASAEVVDADDDAEPAAPTSSIAEASAEVVDAGDAAEPAAPTSAGKAWTEAPVPAGSSRQRPPRRWGDVLRWARGTRSQAEAALVVGWGRDRLARYETGERRIGLDELVEVLDGLAILPGTNVQRLGVDLTAFAELARIAGDADKLEVKRNLWMSAEDARRTAMNDHLTSAFARMHSAIRERA